MILSKSLITHLHVVPNRTHIFGGNTIFFMKSESSLALHRQKHNLKLLFFFSLRTKNIIIAFFYYGCTTDITWTILPMSLLYVSVPENYPFNSKSEL